MANVMPKRNSQAIYAVMNSLRTLVSATACGILWLFSATTLAADQTNPHDFNNRITITEAQGRYLLGSHLAILEDSSRELTIDEVSSPSYADQFAPSEKSTPSFGFSSSVYWARVEIEQKTPQERGWMLELSYAPMQWVDVYTITDDGVLNHKRGGSGLPFVDRPFAHHKHVFELRLPPNSITNLYVRVESESSINIPLRLYRADVFAQVSGRELYALGLYFGVIVGLFCYNLFIYFNIREKAYLYYAGFLAGFVLLTMSLNGLAQQLIWPDNPAIGMRMIPFGQGLASMFVGLFSSAFLQTRHSLPKLHPVLQVGIVWGIVAMVLPWFASYRASILTGSALALTFPVFLFFVAIIAVIRGNHAARYYLLAWCLFLFGVFIYTARAFGLMPNNALTEYGILWGSATEAILLSVALAARMRLMKEEKEAAQQLALENQQLALENQQQALENLHRMDRLKDEFLANTSHELRTPLNGIIGLAEATLHGRNKLAPDTQKNLQTIVASGRRLGSLVNDILDSSKLRHQDIELSPKAIDVRTLGDVVLTLSRPLLEGRIIELTNDIPEN
ncbi:MAG: 7TM diverse intracellular signaling domain-containing protein, partial [Ketobacteraceae bacterium]|nr:7TM diverse intracellular signaling domain-containing protein [Ketobacteraceae bacterium]